MVIRSASSRVEGRGGQGYALIALGAVVSMALIYWQTFLQMVDVWLNSVTFRHGLVIVPISAFMVWRRRSRVARLPVRPCWWAVPVLLVLTMGWLLARLTDISVAQELAMIAMVPTLVMLTLGQEVFKSLRFPLLYLFFAVPVGWFLVPPLMHVTAFMAVQGLKWTGIPVFQDGFRISVPTGDFLVANACSGIRYLIACLALGTLFAYLFYRSWWRRALFMGIALLVPIVANGIRAYGIILLAYLSDMRIATGFDHVIYGFIFFSAILFLMFWLGSLFREDVSHDGEEGGSSSIREAGISAGFGRVAAAAVLGVSLAASGAIGWTTVQHFGATAPDIHTGTLFFGTSTWRGPVPVGQAWHPKFAGEHHELAGRYEDSARSVEVFIEAYAYPHPGKGVISSLNRVADNPHQLIGTSEHRVIMRGSRGNVLKVRQAVVQDKQGTRLVWAWYRVAGRSTASRIGEKLWEALSVLRGEQGWAQWVSVSTPITGGMTSAQAVLKDFLHDNYAALVTCLSPATTGAATCSR